MMLLSVVIIAPPLALWNGKWKMDAFTIWRAEVGKRAWLLADED
jgi:hypothetical protein